MNPKLKKINQIKESYFAGPKVDIEVDKLTVFLNQFFQSTFFKEVMGLLFQMQTARKKVYRCF